MNEQDQRIAIAEACPDIYVRPTGAAGWNYKSSITGRIMPCIDGDPLKDLNAMHEAEKMLTAEQCVEYESLLGNICNRIWHATASQRAAMFLRVIGK